MSPRVNTYSSFRIEVVKSFLGRKHGTNQSHHDLLLSRPWLGFYYFHAQIRHVYNLITTSFDS